MTDTIRVFLAGDVFGVSGMRCVGALLPSFLKAESIDFCVINGENASQGTGLSEKDAQAIFAAGADVITGGNHTFEKRDFWPVFDIFPRVIRPANFPPGALPGSGLCSVEKNGIEFAVLNLQGREGMTALDCPFRAADSELARLENAGRKPVILVDFHAESNEEKEAMGFYLSGRVSSVTGTHTHVQTADERILKGHTAYMSDLGMTGPVRSVIGVDPVLAVKRNITQVLYRMACAEGPCALRGLIVEIDRESRRAVSVRRIELVEPYAP